jgi:hypothetical protein
MISGFLIAISDFVQQVMRESIQEIKLEKHVVTYQKNGPIFIALVSEPKRLTKRKKDLLMKQISSKFFEEYVTYFQEGFIEPGVFSDFEQELNNIVIHFFASKTSKPVSAKKS